MSDPTEPPDKTRSRHIHHTGRSARTRLQAIATHAYGDPQHLLNQQLNMYGFSTTDLQLIVNTLMPTNSGTHR